MLELPDGNQIDMKWKSVSYIKGNKKLYFSIEPMLNCEAIIYFPSKKKWESVEKTFSQKERLEIIFLLERIDWKRKVKIYEVDIMPKTLNKNQEMVISGSMEATQAGRKIEEDALFDPQSPLSKEQVNEIYISLEKRFAENAEGNVSVQRVEVLKDSVLNSIILPILERNAKVKIDYI